MAILSQTKMPSGATAQFHIVHRIEIDTISRLGYAGVRAYTDESAFLAGDPIVAHWTFDIPVPMLGSASVDSIEQVLLNSPESPVFGGILVGDNSETLVGARHRKLHEIRRVRAGVENGGFYESYRLFDSDPVSQQRIQGAAQLATLAKMSSQPFSIDWTLADNSVVTLDADQMIAVGVALGQHINTCHIKARQLRELIEAAQTKEELEFIQWPE